VERISAKADSVFLFVLRKLGWWTIAFLLVFLPFQISIQKWLNLPYQFLWVDEVLILFSFILFFFSLSYLGRIKKEAWYVLVILLVIVIIGYLSTLYNMALFKISSGAIFNYVKNFLPIPIFCLLIIPKTKTLFLYNMLHRVALFLCTFAILQEIAFLVGFPVEKLMANVEYIYTFKRFGFIRTPSLMWHPNEFGLYALFFFILDFSIKRRLRWQNLLLLAGIILSGSRIVWAALFFTFFYLLIQKNKRIIGACFLATMIAIAILVPSLKTAEELTSENYFRRYTILKSVEIWKDHPLLGVGPGMCGGWITPGFRSPIFEKYQFQARWIEAIERGRTLDSFWFQNLVELGLFGALGFVILLIVLWHVAIKQAKFAQDPYRKKLLLGFSAMPIIIGFYLFTNTLNITSFLLTYSILFGMTLGMKDENSFSQ
jgi:hypothetical protein